VHTARSAASNASSALTTSRTTADAALQQRYEINATNGTKAKAAKPRFVQRGGFRLPAGKQQQQAAKPPTLRTMELDATLKQSNIKVALPASDRNWPGAFTSLPQLPV
jgi:hypothetical protein